MALVRPFHRLLVANRGEIAVRIARAARSAGIAPVGIVSDADLASAHADAMDDVVRIGPGEAARSYLDVERVVAAARTLGADAVHPGYGFLSERADFARACAAAGLVFVGPPPEAIEAMGDKAEAKRRARAGDVPVVPGYDRDDLAPDGLRAEAARVGLPLLVKATAGGGGRGLRVVRDLAEFDEAVASARREARSAFGDDRVLMERYVERPRHVEIQILADAHGTIVSLGERECSIQRRHQKVIEEAPSTALDEATRERMTAAAIEVARSVGYVNAGTVEFLLDRDGAFFFLEMNARLQVEHPVTEEAHGLDLVALQLSIARGDRLAAGLGGLPPRRWAIEARVVAEDAGGVPAAGTIARWAPPSGPGVRVDAGVRTGSTVSIFYDSLLAKLIAYGADRHQAVARLRAALDDFEVDGLPTNLPQLRAIARDEAFAAGETTTSFLTDRAAELARPGPASADDAFLLAAAALATDERTWRIGRAGVPLALETEERRLVGTLAAEGLTPTRFRLGGDLAASFEVARDGERLTLAVDADGGPRRLAGNAVVELQPAPSVVVRFAEHRVRVRLAAPPRRADRRAAAGEGGAGVVSPMPGRVVRVAVTAGDAVGERALLVVLEAMKMEHRIVAPGAAVVRTVHVREGAVVPAGAPLVDLERA